VSEEGRKIKDEISPFSSLGTFYFKTVVVTCNNVDLVLNDTGEGTQREGKSVLSESTMFEQSYHGLTSCVLYITRTICYLANTNLRSISFTFMQLQHCLDGKLSKTLFPNFLKSQIKRSMYPWDNSEFKGNKLLWGGGLVLFTINPSA
jgi:hypothetical protein